MSVLRDAYFKNKNILSSEAISKYKLNNIEEIHKDLVDYSAWDMAQPIATVALILKEGRIDQALLTMLGETDQKRFDVKAIFGESYKGGDDHQVKIGKIELQKFCFRGNLVSDWLGPQEFPHSVQRPSATQSGVWRQVEQTKVEADGGQPLWLRAVLQPWTSSKLRMTIGVLAAKDATKVQESSHPRYPFVSLMSSNISVLPSAPENAAVCLPFMPYLIDDREEVGEEDSLPGWATMVRAVNGMFRNNTAPHSKSTMDSLREVLKGDWKAEKRSKYCYPEIELDDEDQEPDNEGMKTKKNEVDE